MVELSEKAVKEFSATYNKVFGSELSESEARSMATQFLEFYAFLHRPKGEQENETRQKETMGEL